MERRGAAAQAYANLKGVVAVTQTLEAGSCGGTRDAGRSRLRRALWREARDVSLPMTGTCRHCGGWRAAQVPNDKREIACGCRGCHRNLDLAVEMVRALPAMLPVRPIGHACWSCWTREVDPRPRCSSRLALGLLWAVISCSQWELPSAVGVRRGWHCPIATLAAPPSLAGAP